MKDSFDSISLCQQHVSCRKGQKLPKKQALHGHPFVHRHPFMIGLCNPLQNWVDVSSPVGDQQLSMTMAHMIHRQFGIYQCQ